MTRHAFWDHLETELEPVSEEDIFDEKLDSLHDFSGLNWPFNRMRPSSVLYQWHTQVYKESVAYMADHDPDLFNLDGSYYLRTQVDDLAAQWVRGGRALPEHFQYRKSVDE